jgi:xyloglucan:xyloglucosyl transferase
MGSSLRRPPLLACAAVAVIIAVACCVPGASAAPPDNATFGDNFEITGEEDHVKTSADGQTWYLYLDNKTGVGFQTKQRYLFGWFSMKLKLVGNDSAGVVTAYYVRSISFLRSLVPCQSLHGYTRQEPTSNQQPRSL